MNYIRDGTKKSRQMVEYNGVRRRRDWGNVAKK